MSKLEDYYNNIIKINKERELLRYEKVKDANKIVFDECKFSIGERVIFNADTSVSNAEIDKSMNVTIHGSNSFLAKNTPLVILYKYYGTIGGQHPDGKTLSFDGNVCVDLITKKEYLIKDNDLKCYE